MAENGSWTREDFENRAKYSQEAIKEGYSKGRFGVGTEQEAMATVALFRIGSTLCEIARALTVIADELRNRGGDNAR